MTNAIKKTDTYYDTYEIGGICVSMTTTQADAWNRGDITRDACEGAWVSVPLRSRGLPYEDEVPLWDFIGGDGGPSDAYTDYMEGCEAVLTRVNPYRTA